jgi:hypothetical protein
MQYLNETGVSKTAKKAPAWSVLPNVIPPVFESVQPGFKRLNWATTIQCINEK